MKTCWRLAVVLALILCSEAQSTRWLQSRARSECYYFECDGADLPGMLRSSDARREAALAAAGPRGSAAAAGVFGLLQQFADNPLGTTKNIRQQLSCLRSTQRELTAAVARLELLTDGFVAQPEAVEEIRRLIRQHLISGGPTVLHIVGNNGVGKSHLAKLVSLALDMAPHPSLQWAASSALLELNLMQVVSSHKHHTLIDSILSFLQRRPDGIVLLDDLQYLADRFDIIDAISSLFVTKEFLGTDVSRALFIITSNFGANYSEPGATSSDRAIQRLFFLQQSTFTNHAITEIPRLILLPAYDRTGFVDMAASKLHNIYCDAVIAERVGPLTPYLEYDARVPDLLAQLAWADGRRLRMGRNVEDKFNDYVVGPLVQYLEESGRLPLTADEIVRIAVADGDQPVFRISIVMRPQ